MGWPKLVDEAQGPHCTFVGLGIALCVTIAAVAAWGIQRQGHHRPVRSRLGRVNRERIAPVDDNRLPADHGGLG
jgi:hypothetical protein